MPRAAPIRMLTSRAAETYGVGSQGERDEHEQVGGDPQDGDQRHVASADLHAAPWAASVASQYRRSKHRGGNDPR